MKRLLTGTLIVLILAISAPVMAHDIEKPVRFGLGAALGWPGIGLSTNTFLYDEMSLQANAYAFWNFKGAAFDLDWLFWLHDIAKTNVLEVTWYAGPGAGLYFVDTGFGSSKGSGSYAAGFVKGSVGLALQFNSVPMDLTWQVSPGVQFGEFGAWWWATGMMATRYYF